MSIFQIVAVGILGAVLSLTLKRQDPQIALLVAITASVLIFLMVLPMLSETVQLLSRLGEMAGGEAAYIAVGIRVIGVAYIAEFGASVCSDANESAIAAKIELAGRVVILVMAMPVVVDIVRVVTGLLV
jgi:stage III sporulation protein AD